MKLSNLKILSCVEMNSKADYCSNRHSSGGGYLQPYYKGTVDVDGITKDFEVEDTSLGHSRTRYNVRLGKEWSGEFGSMEKRPDHDPVPEWALEILELIKN